MVLPKVSLLKEVLHALRAVGKEVQGARHVHNAEEPDASLLDKG